jgi:hypothetical protein
MAVYKVVSVARRVSARKGANAHRSEGQAGGGACVAASRFYEKPFFRNALGSGRYFAAPVKDIDILT